MDAPTETPIILRGHLSWATDMVMSEDGFWLITGGHDETVHLWDLQTIANSSLALTGHTASINDLALNSDGEWLTSVSGDQTVRLWNLDNAALQAIACDIVDRNLTEQEQQQYFPSEDATITCENLPESAGLFFEQSGPEPRDK